MFQNVTNSNYIVGFLCVMAVGVCSAYYFVLDRKINKLINKFSNENYPPLYTERA
jgi:drug/metabolite transporter (DMT)-like permease